MEKQSFHDHEGKNNRPHFREQLIHDIEKYVPHLEISEEDIDFTVEILDLMHDKYGDPESEDYLPYHNGIHASDVTKRILKLSSVYQRHAPELIDNRSIVLAMIAGAGHDIIQKQATAEATDEMLSAEYMEAWMIERGYEPLEAARVGGAIIATTAEKTDRGVEQTRVQEGNADPIKLIVAMADIQAMTMEGKNRMLTDVACLYFEINPPSSKTPIEHIEGLSKFLLNQLGFVVDRLDSIPGDLRYYFPEDVAQAIERDNRKEFRKNGLAALHTAKDIKAAATHLVDTLAEYIDTIPETPIQASRLARKALKKVIANVSHR